MKRFCALLLFVILSCGGYARQPLSVEEIMKGEYWIGFPPDNIHWDISSEHVYFDWKPTSTNQKDVFRISINRDHPEKVADTAIGVMRNTAVVYSADRTKALFERNGDIIIADVATGDERYITRTAGKESDPLFSLDERLVMFRNGNNLYSVAVAGSEVKQLTNFRMEKPPISDTLDMQDQWLKKKQVGTFDALKNHLAETGDKKDGRQNLPGTFYLNGRALSVLSISPDLNYVTFTLMQQPAGRNIIVPNYVTPSGYTENIPGRTKVGAPPAIYESYIYDRRKDRFIAIQTDDIPGISDIPAYLKEYPEKYQAIQAADVPRAVQVTGYWWNKTGTAVVVNIRSQDNKDRWIMKLNPQDGSLSLLDHQHDNAWIAGPGISRPVIIGWVNDHLLYFQSEASGYSHIYTVDPASAKKTQLTSGKYEVQKLRLSNDGTHFYFTANIKNPGNYHFYRLPVRGGVPEQLTTMDGNNEVILSPDEKWLAVRYSYINKPWELYLQQNTKNAQPARITNSTTAAFNAYPWKLPETVTFRNRVGKDVYAHIFQPEVPDTNRPAIVFVHSNGYLQNVHYGWSYHYREYLFNNLLVDLGYTVINIDYTGSAGYGRDFRTGIYRHMGGTDLTDLVDGVKLLTSRYGVNPEYVGLYGGSYGGFLTLMGLFTEAETFKTGAALRSVTDWSNYNGRYTSNILNTPVKDPVAYRRSSPLFFADGFKGHLLMTHGVVDVNVNFQDIVLLTQKLIELRKDNWELAIYPLEDHDFTHASSWTDQYKRILKLFNSTLLAK